MSELMTVNDNQVAAPSSDNMASMFMKMAMNPECDVDKLEKLMALYERDEARKAQVSFNSDFAAMQSDITTVSKNSKVDYQTAKGRTFYSFASLEDIVDMVRPVLQKHGFAVSFNVNTSNGVNVQCSLMHKKGHSIETSMQVRADNSGGKNDVQALGSSISYAKRYTLSSLLNIATRDDDDAQAAAQKDSRVITAGQSKTLEAKFSQLTDERQDSFIAWLQDRFKVDSIPEVRASDFNAVVSGINKVIASLDKESA